MVVRNSHHAYIIHLYLFDVSHCLSFPFIQWTREEVIEMLSTSEAIILDLFHNPDQSQTVLEYLKHTEAGIDQMLIGISTVLTWNRTNTKPTYNPLASNKTSVLNEINFKKRKCSPRFRGIRQLESLVLATQRDNLFSYIVAPGILYGRGESDFHLLFRDAWLADRPLKVLGQGANVIPTVHVEDMANCVLQLIYTPPTHTQYCVLVDAAHTTQAQIVTAIAQHLGNGAVDYISRQDAELQALVQSLSQDVPSLAAGLASPPSTSLLSSAASLSMAPSASTDGLVEAELPVTSLAVPPCDGLGGGDPDVLLLDLSFSLEGAIVASLPVQWKCPGGLTAAFETVRGEYVKARGLEPIRVLVSGGPGSGKTHYAQLLASRYKLPVVSVGECLAKAAEGKGLLAETIRSYVHEIRDGDGKRKVQAKKPIVKGKGQGNVADTYLTDRLPEKVVCEAVRRVLMEPKARNHGFVLDGFPRTGKEAKLLFKLRKKVEAEEEEEGEKPEEEDNSWNEEPEEGEHEEEEEEEHPDQADAEKEQLLAMLREEEAEEVDNSANTSNTASATAGTGAARHSGVSLLHKVGLRAGARRNGKLDPALRVNHVVYLSVGEEESVRQSRELMDPAAIIPRHNDEEGLRRRWARWSLQQGQFGCVSEEKTAEPREDGGSVFNWVDAEVLEVGQRTAADPKHCMKLLQAYISQQHPEGPYFASPEVYAQQQAKREERLRIAAAKVSEQRAARARAMAAERARKSDVAVRMREAARKQEEELVEACSLPLRQFLMKHVVGAVVDGLMDVCNAQPSDPIDHLAEYLFNVAVNSVGTEARTQQ